MAFKIDQEFRNANRRLTTQEYSNLHLSIQRDGGGCPGSIIVALIDGETILIDGHNTYDICTELKYKIPDELVIPMDSREDVLEWIHNRQRSRRNLSVEDMKMKRAERLPRVIEARQDGQSIRAIAEQENVSKNVIERDLEATGVLGQTPLPPGDKIIGKDGVSQPATKPKSEPILCVGCQTKKRKGQELPKGCINCKDAKAAAKPKGKAGPRKKKPAADDQELPKSVRNALADTWHADCAHTLAKFRQQCKGAFSWSSWLDAAVLDHLKAAEECFLTAIPRKVCPDCKGKKQLDKKPCQKCRHGGYMAGQV